MVCACCDSKVGLVSGKGSGYYGCFAAYRRACDNRVLVPRRLAEDIILRSVCKRLLEPKPLLHVLQRVEEEAQRLYPEIPGRSSSEDRRSEGEEEESSELRCVRRPG